MAYDNKKYSRSFKNIERTKCKHLIIKDQMFPTDYVAWFVLCAQIHELLNNQCGDNR